VTVSLNYGSHHNTLSSHHQPVGGSATASSPTLATSIAYPHGTTSSSSTPPPSPSSHRQSPPPLNPSTTAFSSTVSFTEAVRKGKAPMLNGAGPSKHSPVSHNGFTAASAFMADAWCTTPNLVATLVSPTDSEADAKGWQVVTRHICGHHRTKAVTPPLPPAPRRSVPVDLIGRCFNCLRKNHIAVVCPNAARCLRCHMEDHQAPHYKRPCTPDATSPPCRL
jgi:hypothetical protein